MLVMKAYKLIKGNAGAAGVDHQSLASFEQDLKKQSLQGLESDVIGELFSTPGESGCNTEKERR
jgi:hypothetical protein